jgi:acyl-CoA thioesterase I
MLREKIKLKEKIFVSLLFISLLVLPAMSYYGKVYGTVVCFGDSITHGAKVDGHSWVYFLSKNHKNINFVNEGRNGRKTSDKNEILPVLKKYPKADYFLIFLGVNDLKNGNDSMVNNCIENMKWMISKIREANQSTKIVILAPVDISLKTMDTTNVRKKYNENTRTSLVKLEKKYKKLAKEDSLGFISLLKSVTPQNYVDGVHPDEKGQQQIAESIWQGLTKLFN